MYFRMLQRMQADAILEVHVFVWRLLPHADTPESMLHQAKREHIMHTRAHMRVDRHLVVCNERKCLTEVRCPTRAFDVSHMASQLQRCL